MDLWGRCGERVPIELLVGGLGRGPCCVCERKDAMWGVALEGLEVHAGSVRFVSEGKGVRRIVTKEEAAEHWPEATIRANGPHLEVFGVCKKGAVDILSDFTWRCVSDSITSHLGELPSFCGLETLISIGC